ncbi:hypothetical protein GBAR_LOCUS31065 [Geodia barretti]|uniref:Uncharacterized protein n=1 Tax=Geodia barretti TaxID=519541 RepID=A0AA35XLQ1_GEOBA|nr:hypothetical protein GBAR_LOCUS31065 [Geodia barretti]
MWKRYRGSWTTITTYPCSLMECVRPRLPTVLCQAWGPRHAGARWLQDSCRHSPAHRSHQHALHTRPRVICTTLKVLQHLVVSLRWWRGHGPLLPTDLPILNIYRTRP